MDDREAEIAEIARLVREHLAWEEELAGSFVPPWQPEERTEAPAPSREPEHAAEPQPEPVPEHVVTSVQVRAPVVAEPESPARVALPLDQKVARLKVLADEAAGCTICRLHESRTRSVFSRGTPGSEVAFVGEGPGYNEDQSGLPFVGPAGQLLDKMIVAMGFGRDDVYVCNVVKCRPPENRTPLPDEAGACDRYLTPQLEIVAPKVIVALGRCAAEHLGCAEPGRSWRGMWGSWRNIPVMPTYHPAFLLRSPEMKRPVWEDLQKVLQRLGRQVPKRS